MRLRTHRLAEALVVATLVVLPWCLGGALLWTTWLLVALASVTALVLPPRLPPLALAAALVPGLLQLIPLPEAVLGALSPDTLELKSFTLGALGFPPPYAATLDVSATATATARLLALVLLGGVAARLANDPKAASRLTWTLALSAASIAACGYLHRLARLDALFGWHRFGTANPFITPFGNENHLVAFLALGATCALALAKRERLRSHAFGLGALALFTAAPVFLVGSRAGAAVLLLTWGLLGLRFRLPWLVLGGCLLAGVAVGFERLEQRSLALLFTEEGLSASKLSLWPQVLRLASRYPWTGVGLGAFELAWPRYLAVPATETLTHPENLPLQLLVELGAPMALLLMACALVALWHLGRAGKGDILFVALAGVLLHDCFDFSLSMNGVAPAVAVLVGLLVASRRWLTELQPRRTLAAASAAALAALFALGSERHEAASERLAAAATTRAPEDFRLLAITLVRRHPADWVLYATAAEVLSFGEDPRDALAWANRAFFLRPREPAALRASARALERLGQSDDATNDEGGVEGAKRGR